MRKSLITLSVIITFISVWLLACKIEKKTTEPAEESQQQLLKRGEYLVNVMGCDDCHSPKNMGPKGPEIDMNLRFSGYPANRPLPKVDTAVIKKGFVVFNGDLTASAGMWGMSFAANISSDETGIGNWSEEQFTKAFTQGKWKGMDSGRPLMPPMPWFNFAKLEQKDVKAIYTFLKSTKPVKNVHPAILPLTEL